MIVAGIDPGSKESGVVVWAAQDTKLVYGAVLENDFLLTAMRQGQKQFPLFDCVEVVAIEQIRGYGVKAGNDTFDTCEWAGRFREAFECRRGRVIMQPRKVAMEKLCGVTNTTDKFIRMALIDRYGEPGTKKAPGPLFGISGHLWSALAVAVTVTI